MSIPQFKLTVQGENFIKSICSGNGNSLLVGTNNKPFPYCDPEITVDKIWTSFSGINGDIKTNEQLGLSLIKWYNEYSDLCKIDANFLAAQTFIESGYKVWNYSNTGSMGIGQFTPATIFDVIIKSNSTMDNLSKIIMTADERDYITYGIPTNIINDVNNFTSWKRLAPYREQLFQNIVDAPRIIVKMQFRYMKYIANLYSKYPNNSLASHVLFGYNRGYGYIKKSYSGSIEYAKIHGKIDEKGNSYEKEGIKYVYKIFDTLYKNFGYTELNMNIPTSNFDSTTANIDDPV